MRTAWLGGPGRITIEETAPPDIIDPSDVIVDISYAGVCGSDLWGYRGLLERPAGGTGHEFIGRVGRVGEAVHPLRVGDQVIAPFMFSDGSCDACRGGLPPLCPSGGLWGHAGTGGAQAEQIRVPFADATLTRLPDEPIDDELARRLLPLADVFATGTYGARLAGVVSGDTVAVVGDGAVGISAGVAALRAGAAHVVLLGEREGRLAIARSFGIETALVTGGQPAADILRERTGGVLADRVIECVGMQAAFDTALDLVRSGGGVGFVGVPHGVAALDPKVIFDRAIRLAGGVAPAREYLAEFVDATYRGDLDVSALIDRVYPLERAADAYAAMDSGEVLKAALVII